MTSPPAPAPDRYVSFRGIDFEGRMDAVLGHLRRYIDNPATGNAFWDRFKRLLDDAGGTAPADKLLLLHSHVYYLVDLFEEHDDEAALAALRQLEEDCF